MYQWVCHSCRESNPPGIGSCSRCGFPAIASGREVSGVIPPSLQTNDSSHQEKEKSKGEFFRLNEIAGFPTWKQVIAVLLWLAEVLAAIVFSFSSSWTGTIGALVACAFIEALYQFLRKTEPSPRHA